MRERERDGQCPASVVLPQTSVGEIGSWFGDIVESGESPLLEYGAGSVGGEGGDE